MGLSLAADRLLELLVNGRHQERDRIGAYLDALADDAQALATLWSAALERLTAAPGEPVAPAALVLDEPTLTVLQRLPNPWVMEQSATHERLMLHYRRATLTLADRLDAELRESLLCRVAGALEFRRDARELVLLITGRDQDADASADALVFDANTQPRRIRALADLVEALHREAAAVRFFVREYRARA